MTQTTYLLPDPAETAAKASGFSDADYAIEFEVTA